MILYTGTIIMIQSSFSIHFKTRDKRPSVKQFDMNGHLNSYAPIFTHYSIPSVILFRIVSMEMTHNKGHDIANKMLNFWTLTPGRRRIEENLPKYQRNQTTLKYQSSKKENFDICFIRISSRFIHCI